MMVYVITDKKRLKSPYIEYLNYLNYKPMNRLKANIDNKNVMEWFSEDFHGGTYIARMNNKITCQVFYMENCLCELSYRFGQNWFRCRIIEGSPEDVRKCTTTIEKVVMSLNGDNVKVIFNPILGVYEFYFVES